MTTINSAITVEGILQRMRMHGAVDHPYLNMYRNEKLNSYALNWVYDQRHFLNKRFGGGVQFPKLVELTTSNETENYLIWPSSAEKESRTGIAIIFRTYIMWHCS